MSINLAFKKAPQQTIDFLKKKKLKTSFDYKELEHEAHQKAFTVAKIMQLDVLADIQKSLTTAIAEGKSFKKWKKEIKPLLIEKGWYGKKEIINPDTGEIKNTYIGSRRLKTIFETNMRTSHAAGRANNIYKSTKEYLQYKAILDSKTREDHKAYDGIIKHKNDSFWAKNFPPNGWGCRCYVISLSLREILRKGLKVDKRDYGDFADNDFAYDVRFLSKELLESTYFSKATKLNNKTISKKAIDYIYSQNRVNEYESFIDEVMKDIKYHKSLVPAGALNYEIYEFLKTKDIEPQTPHVYLSKHSLTHMIREVKKKRDAALSIDDIKALPEALKNPYMIIFDNIHKNVLYLINSNDRENKIAVEVNYTYKKEKTNMIVTTGKVDIKTVEGQIKEGKYEVIKR